jgi:hypothetical protein
MQPVQDIHFSFVLLITGKAHDTQDGGVALVEVLMMISMMTQCLRLWTR